MRLIDADELKKCVLKWLPQDPCGKEEKEMPFETDICASMLMEIDEQPTIQPEPNWIHVSEQLPEEEVDVLCVTHAGAMFVASYGQLYFDPNEKGWITAECNRFCTEFVYAWTELPVKPKRGKWLLDGHHVRCDQCGIYMCNTDREGDPIPRFFCPNCGADMRDDERQVRKTW